jgi:hypothetical protein
MSSIATRYSDVNVYAIIEAVSGELDKGDEKRRKTVEGHIDAPSRGTTHRNTGSIKHWKRD